MEHKTWWKAITYPERIDYVGFQNDELVFVLAIEKLLGLEIRRRPPGCGCCSASSTGSTRTRLPRHRGARAGGDLDVLVLLPRARPGARPLRTGHRGPHAHAVLPGRRAGRGHPVRLLRRGAQVLRLDAEGGRRLRSADRASGDLARANAGNRPPLGRGCDRARPVRAVLRASGVDWDLRGRSPTWPTTRSSSASRSTRTATSTTAIASGSTRCASRFGSSSSASTGSRACRASRGSPTTARSSCRRGTSSTPRWSR